MKKEYTWEIVLKNTPLAKKKCNHCDSNLFYCSEKFRINSQKKNLDVWLIYRCTKCDSTYNITILSRIKADQIDKDMLRKFMDNDTATTWQYAFSSHVGRRNNVEFDFSNVEYDIKHAGVSISDILTQECETVTFKVKCGYESNIKLSLVVRQCLGLSANQLKRLVEANAIYSDDAQSIIGRKAKDGDTVHICKAALDVHFNL